MSGGHIPERIPSPPQRWKLVDGHLDHECFGAGDERAAPACPECLHRYLERNRERLITQEPLDRPDRWTV